MLSSTRNSSSGATNTHTHTHTHTPLCGMTSSDGLMEEGGATCVVKVIYIRESPHLSMKESYRGFLKSSVILL